MRSEPKPLERAMKAEGTASKPGPATTEAPAQTEAMAYEAMERRAADAEHRLYSFRQHRAARDRQLAELIKERAPDLWPDYADISVNGAAGQRDIPNYGRELNILQHRAEKSEEEATKLRATLRQPARLEAEIERRDKLLREVHDEYGHRLPTPLVNSIASALAADTGEG